MDVDTGPSRPERHTKQQQQPGYNDKRTVHHQAHLIEPIIRHRIQDSIFYKQHLYLTNESTILPVVVQHVQYVGGTDSVGRPSAFLCCLLRLLELEPSKEVIALYLNQCGYNEFKYLTALVLMYIRLVYSPPDIFVVFDEYIKDYRKLRVKLKFPRLDDRGFAVHYDITHIDEWSDTLLEDLRVIDVVLPRLLSRSAYVDRQLVSPRHYAVTSQPSLTPEENISSDQSDNEVQSHNDEVVSDYDSDSD